MSTIATDKGDFEPVPQGVHLAICIMVIDGGTQHLPKFNNWTHQLKIVWEIPSQLIKINDEEKPMTIQQNFTCSLNKKANLRKVLESWRGKAFTEQELLGFDVKNVLGKACQINVVHNQSDGTTYANIGAIMPAQTKAPDPVHPLIYFDLDNHSTEQWNQLPEWIQKWVSKSREMQTNQPAHVEYPNDGFDDDIPF